MGLLARVRLHLPAFIWWPAFSGHGLNLLDYIDRLAKVLKYGMQQLFSSPIADGLLKDANRVKCGFLILRADFYMAPLFIPAVFICPIWNVKKATIRFTSGMDEEGCRTAKAVVLEQVVVAERVEATAQAVVVMIDQWHQECSPSYELSIADAHAAADVADPV